MASADLHGGVKAVISGPGNATIEEMQASLKARHPRMTVRELEVAARVRTGMSARQIAAELGIAETTVITHRNSAYARMGVANLRELLLAQQAFGRLPTNRELLHRLATLHGRCVVQQCEYRA